MSWRDHAAPIIAKVIERVGREDMKALKKALREAYPYGERSHHPYKIWCSEVRYQLGLKKRFERIPKYGSKAVRPAAGQGSLFD
jgi:hypothetical protein